MKEFTPPSDCLCELLCNEKKIAEHILIVYNSFIKNLNI